MARWWEARAWTRPALLRSFVISLLLAAALPASAEERRLPEALEEVLGLARALPADFAADVLLRASNHPALQKTKRRREILEDALVLGARARQAWPMQYLDLDIDTRPLELDAVSLQLRAIEALGDPQLLDRIPAPPGRLTCADRTLWDSSRYWRTLARLKVLPVRPLASVLEIGPVVGMIEERKLEGEELERMTGWLVDGLGRLDADDRAFAAVVRQAPRYLETLAILRARAGLAPRIALDALRRFLIQHLSGERCGDTLAQSTAAGETFVWYFNDRLRMAGYLAQEELPRILESDIQPASVVPVDVPAEPEWFEEWKELRSAPVQEQFDSPLSETQPLAWFLLVKGHLRDATAREARNPIVSCYAKLAALKL